MHSGLHLPTVIMIKRLCSASFNTKVGSDQIRTASLHCNYNLPLDVFVWCSLSEPWPVCYFQELDEGFRGGAVNYTFINNP